MNDLTPDDPHAPSANDVTHQSLKPFLEAMAEGIPHCAECNKPLYIVKGNAKVHHKCQVNDAMTAKGEG